MPTFTPKPGYDALIDLSDAESESPGPPEDPGPGGEPGTPGYPPRWCLNGRPLGLSTGTRVEVPHDTWRSTRATRQRFAGVLGGEEDAQKGGLDDERASFEFLITGPYADVFDELARIQGVLETDAVWTLQAPGGYFLRIWRDKQRAPMRTLSARPSIVEGVGIARLRVDAMVLGAWLVDGGAFVERIRGWFRKTATGWEDEQGNAWTAAEGPRINIPIQETGYLRALNPGTMVFDTLIAVDTLDSHTETYSLSGYLHPAPVAVGDVGLYELDSSPNSDGLVCVSDLTPEENPMKCTEATEEMPTANAHLGPDAQPMVAMVGAATHLGPDVEIEFTDLPTATPALGADEEVAAEMPTITPTLEVT